ncbi:MAG: rhodanese-like domain-containing protein [Thermoplasmatota archaeon]
MNITPQAAHDEGAIILDVRTPAERAQAHIEGSHHIPLDQLPQRLDELPEGRIVCQCLSGGRSAQAAMFLAQQGRDVANMAGGIQAWHAAGLPLIHG